MRVADAAPALIDAPISIVYALCRGRADEVEAGSVTAAGAFHCHFAETHQRLTGKVLGQNTSSGPPLGADAPVGNRSGGGASAGTILGVVLVVALLHLGRDVLIPFAIAILLSFVLAPLVTRLRHVGLPRVPAVMLIVTLAFTGSAVWE
jgi:hypothetical protein